MARRANINSLVRAASRQYGIPEAILHGLIKVESGGDINAVSSAGAFGLTQFMPGTAREYGVRRGDARSQIFGAAHYLSDLGYHKNPRLALASYNAGPGNPGAAGNYPEKVFAAAGQAGGGTVSSSVTDPVTTPTSPTPSSASTPSSPNIFEILFGLEQSGGQDPLALSNLSLLAGLTQPTEPTSPSGSLGTDVVAPSGSPRDASSVDAIVNDLLKQFPGLKVSSGHRSAAENARVGGSPRSLHLSNRARDIVGPNDVLTAAFRYLERNYGPQLHELFFDPVGHYLKRGQRVRGAIGGHRDHLHFGV